MGEEDHDLDWLVQFLGADEANNISEIDELFHSPHHHPFNNNIATMRNSDETALLRTGETLTTTAFSSSPLPFLSFAQQPRRPNCDESSDDSFVHVSTTTTTSHSSFGIAVASSSRNINDDHNDETDRKPSAAILPIKPPPPPQEEITKLSKLHLHDHHHEWQPFIEFENLQTATAAATVETEHTDGTHPLPMPMHDSKNMMPPPPPSLATTSRTTTTYTNLTKETLAVCIGWGGHPGTKLWRSFIQELASNPHVLSWSDALLEQVKARLATERITDFYIDAMEHHKTKGTPETRKKLPASWRMATPKEVLEKSRKRFLDFRKPSAASTTSTKRPAAAHQSSPPLVPMNNKRARIAAELQPASRQPQHQPTAAVAMMRQPQHQPTDVAVAVMRPSEYQPSATVAMMMRQPQDTYPIIAMSVCLGWRRHPGTVAWREVVNTFAADTDVYPQWDSRITDWVRNKLAEDNISVFFVFRNEEDGPCKSIDDGLWVRATMDEVSKATEEQFEKYRRQLEPSPSATPDESSNHGAGGGGDNGMNGNPPTNGSSDNDGTSSNPSSPSTGDNGSSGHPSNSGTSGPSSNFERGGNPGPSSQTMHQAMVLDANNNCSDFTSSDEEMDDEEACYNSSDDDDDDYDYEYDEEEANERPVLQIISKQDNNAALQAMPLAAVSANGDKSGFSLARPESALPINAGCPKSLLDEKTSMSTSKQLPILLDVKSLIRIAIGPQIQRKDIANHTEVTPLIVSESKTNDQPGRSECFGWITSTANEGLHDEQRRKNAMRNYFRFSPTCSDHLCNRMKKALEVWGIRFIGSIDNLGSLLEEDLVGNQFSSQWLETVAEDGMEHKEERKQLLVERREVNPVELDTEESWEEHLSVGRLKKLSQVLYAIAEMGIATGGQPFDQTQPTYINDENFTSKLTPSPTLSNPNDKEILEGVSRSASTSKVLQQDGSKLGLLNAVAGIRIGQNARQALLTLVRAWHLDEKPWDTSADFELKLAALPSAQLVPSATDMEECKPYSTASVASSKGDGTVKNEDLFMKDDDLFPNAEESGMAMMDTIPEATPSSFAAPAADSTATVSADIRAVTLGSVKHPSIPDSYTETWRKLLKENFSTKFDEYPIWIDDIAAKMKELVEKEGGIDRFLVYVDKDHRVDDKFGSGAFRNATDQEILESTKQQFDEDRRLVVTTKASATRRKQPKHRPRRSETTRN